MPKPKSAEAPSLFLDGELPPAAGVIEQKAFDMWNTAAEAVGWPKATKLSPTRIKGLKKAVLEAGGLAEWQAMLERAGRSTFLTVKWRPTLEFFFQAKQILKVQEGGHDDQPVAGPNSAVGGLPPSSGDPWQRWVPGYRLGGFWPLHLGPRPEAAGCRATPSLLIAWRRENGVEVVVPQTETREQRMAGSIALYRRLGKHDRANALEEELSALEGRPPILVPHPSVADHNKPSEAKTGPAVDLRGRPPGPITDISEEPPEWDSVPEGDEAMAEP